MLAKFAVTNYRGFRDRIEWDLSSPANYEFNQFAVKEGIIKNGIIYGPNGSGKSNLSLAIFDIVNHLSQKWKKIDYYSNYVYAGRKDEPVEFEYTFRFDATTLEYFYTKDAHGVLLSEALVVDGRRIFTREEGRMSINRQEFPIGDSIAANLGKNANNVSIVNFLLTSYPLGRDHYLIRLQNFINSMLWFRNLDDREFIGLETRVWALDEYIISKGLQVEFSKFLQRVSGQHYQFSDKSYPDKNLYCNIDGSEVIFRTIASTGTRALELVFFWLQRMKAASFVFIDEFDAFYHFDLSFDLCKKDLFSLNCQVFTSTHNTSIMTNDLLRPDCYFILDRNMIKPLCRCTERELREAHNLEKIYKAGGFYVE